MEEMKSEIERLIGAVKAEIGDGYEIRHKRKLKNNGVVRHAIMIRQSDERVGQQIYVDHILEGVMEGETNWEEAAHEVGGIFRRGQNMGCRYENMLDSLDKQEVLRRVECRLINTKWNKELIGTLPHKEMLDLSIVYRIALDNDGSVMVTDEICSRYGIGLEELDDAARRNTEQRGFSVHPMSEVIAEIVGTAHGEYNGPEIFVMTSMGGRDGAAVMLYPQYAERLAQEIGSDLYILPSSIHEVIAVPETEAEPEVLGKMVQEINRTDVAEEEVLSESVYRYSRKNKRITVAYGHGAVERVMGEYYKRMIMQRFMKIE